MVRESTNIVPYWQRIKETIKESDIVLNILDARLVELSRNAKLEELIKGIRRPIIYVINKADLVSKRALEIAVDKLKEQGIENIIYVSCKRKFLPRKDPVPQKPCPAKG